MSAKNLAFLTAKPKMLRFLLIYVLNIRNFLKERKMKKFLVFAAMFAAAFMMVSCGGDLNGEGNEGESEFTDKATAYFPDAYAEKTLAAWYSLTETDEDRIKIEAIFLFDDNTLIKTTSKVYSEADGREPSDELEATGEFTITSGDYDNGEAHVVLAGGEMEFDVTISGGVLSAMGAEFIKQDNADAPEAR